MPATAHEFRVFNLAWGLALSGRRGRFPKGIIKVTPSDKKLIGQLLKAKGVSECTEEWWEKNRIAHGLEEARQADVAKRVADRTAAEARVKKPLPTLAEIKASGHGDPKGLLKELEAERAAEASDLFGPGPGDIDVLKANPSCVDSFNEEELREVLGGLGIQPPRRARLKVLREIAREGLRGTLKVKAPPAPALELGSAVDDDTELFGSNDEDAKAEAAKKKATADKAARAKAFADYKAAKEKTAKAKADAAKAKAKAPAKPKVDAKGKAAKDDSGQDSSVAPGDSQGDAGDEH